MLVRCLIFAIYWTIEILYAAAIGAAWFIILASLLWFHP